MHGLQVNEAHWEDICIYLMGDILNRTLGGSGRYDYFGTSGQKQWGVDLVCHHYDYSGVVAQCKFKGDGSPLTWEEVLRELEKTERYPGPITHYYVLTTAKRNTKLYLELRARRFEYQREKGDSFRVTVLYWDSFKNIGFIPKHKLFEFFPVAMTMAEYLKTPFDHREFSDSAEQLQQQIPKLLSYGDLENFSDVMLECGYIFKSHYDKIQTLGWLLHDTKIGMTKIPSYLFKPEIRSLAKCFPAGRLFARALSEFCSTVDNRVIGDSIEMGSPPQPVEILSITKPDEPRFFRIAHREISDAARILTYRYRHDILGDLS